MSYGGESCEITHRRFYTQTLSQTPLGAEAFTHRSPYTQMLLHRTTCAQGTFTHRRFYTEAFTCRSFYAQKQYTVSFYTQKQLRRDACTQEGFCTGLRGQRQNLQFATRAIPAVSCAGSVKICILPHAWASEAHGDKPNSHFTRRLAIRRAQCPQRVADHNFGHIPMDVAEHSRLKRKTQKGRQCRCSVGSWNLITFHVMQLRR